MKTTTFASSALAGPEMAKHKTCLQYAFLLIHPITCWTLDI